METLLLLFITIVPLYFTEVTMEMAHDTPDNVKALADEVLKLNVKEINLFVKTIQRRFQIPDEEFYARGSGDGGSSGNSERAVEAVEEVSIERNLYFHQSQVIT